jgi:hypothetical protein
MNQHVPFPLPKPRLTVKRRSANFHIDYLGPANPKRQ